MARKTSDAQFGTTRPHDDQPNDDQLCADRLPGEEYGTDDRDVVLYEERLVVDTQKVRSRAIRLRTKVVTEEQTVTVPLRREVLEIIELDDDPDSIRNVTGLKKPREIILHEERIAVETVAYEKVRFSRSAVEEVQSVQDQVRREVLEVDEGPR